LLLNLKGERRMKTLEKAEGNCIPAILNNTACSDCKARKRCENFGAYLVSLKKGKKNENLRS